MEIFDELNK
jgi:hypothetical protein